MTTHLAKDKPKVLVVGAGPTGLFLSLVLMRQGVQVRLIDQKSSPIKESRAMGVQARTLEFYRQLGLSEALVKLGVQTENTHLGVNGRKVAQFSLKNMGQGLSPYPYLLTLAQDVHESFLVEQLAACGLYVEWNTTLKTLAQDGTTVKTIVTLPDGSEEEIETSYLVGCDGARSTTRQALGIAFGGGTSEGLFYVADVDIGRNNQDVHVGIAPDTLALMMPVRTSGMQRILGIVPKTIATQANISFNDVSQDSAHLLNIKVKAVNWFSTYRVHHRVAERFREGRCFIAGDAGHIHSPVGGQGMNTGLGDAMNLAWKLAQVINNRADAKLLNTYEPERIKFARQLINTTDGMFQKMIAEGWFTRYLRVSIVPSIIKLLTRYPITKRSLFKAVSQIRIAYTDSPLSQGKQGRISAGERLPFVHEIDNHQSLNCLDWQLHIYGEPSESLTEPMAKLGLTITLFPYSPAVSKAGFARNQAYLIRPDGYIALIITNQNSTQLADYVQTWGLKFSPQNG